MVALLVFAATFVVVYLVVGYAVISALFWWEDRRDA